MGAKTSRGRQDKHGTILMVGLDGAGKTTIANMLKRERIFRTEHTRGCTLSLNAFGFKEYNFSICDVGGSKHFRYMWRNFKQNDVFLSWAAMCGVIFVVDSSDLERITEAKKLYSELHQHLAKDHRRPVLPVLVIANKQDLSGALAAHEVSDRLSLEQYKLCGWQVTFQFTALDGVGLDDAVWILYKMIKKREKLLKKIDHHE